MNWCHTCYYLHYCMLLSHHCNLHVSGECRRSRRRCDDAVGRVFGCWCVVCCFFLNMKPFTRVLFVEFKRLRSLQNAKKTFAASRAVLKFRVLDLLECVPQRTGGEHLIVHIIGERRVPCIWFAVLHFAFRAMYHMPSPR
jgi:hypothetical protein